MNCSWMWNSIDGADASNVDEVGLVGAYTAIIVAYENCIIDWSFYKNVYCDCLQIAGV